MRAKTSEISDLIYATVELQQHADPTLIYAVGDTVLLGTSSCDVVAYNFNTGVLT